jgi:UPF0755 protein
MKRKLLSLLLVFTLIAGYFAWRGYQIAFANNVSMAVSYYELFVAPKTTWEELKAELDSVLIRPEDFRLLAEWKDLPGNVKSGRYTIHHNLNNNTLVNRLRAGIQDPVLLTLNMARDLADVAGQAGKHLQADSLAFIKYLESEAVLSDFGLEPTDLPGIFLSNTYEFYWNTSPKDFVKRMLRESSRFWEKRATLLEQSGLSQAEVITLASIVESETAKADEMPKVAGLYLNRLEKGIKLQSDPTVIYAHQLANKDTVIRRVWNKYLSIDSPYNTYKYAGLPPGPIRIPDPRSIDAVLKAEKHSYIFMCADPDRPGYHAFARTNRQHNVNRAKYQRWANQNGIY